MLDILTIVHSFADAQTASRIRRTCRRLAALIPHPVLYSKVRHDIEYEYRVGSLLHRLDSPARVYASGRMSWYRGGIRHREYHPQYISERGRGYILDGVYHREAGPSVIYSDTDVDWHLRGVLHRKVGPAYAYTGSWYTRGKLHRLDGPIRGNIYSIRGRRHSISCTTGDVWVIDDTSIRI